MATNPVQPEMTFDSAPVKQDTPVNSDSGMTFDAAPVKQDTPVWNGALAQPPAVDTVASDATKIPNARIRNMTVDPTKDVHSAGEAFLSGAGTGIEAAAIPASVYGADFVGLLGKEAVKQIAKMAAEHPEAAKYIARTIARGVSGYAGEKLGGHTGAIIGLLMSHSLGL